MKKVIFAVLMSLALSAQAKPENERHEYDKNNRATVVAEPEVYGMMLAGLGLIGYVVRRNKGRKD